MVVKSVELPIHNQEAWCKQAPVAASGVELTNEQAAYVPGEIGSNALIELTLAYVSGGRYLLRGSDEDLLMRNVNKRRCAVESGLYSCGIPGSSVLIHTGKASGYFAPNDRPFIVICGLGISIGPDECRVHYLLNDWLALSYRSFRRPKPGGRSRRAIGRHRG